MRIGKRAAKFLPWGIYSALALLVLGPLLQRGYIFALDMVFTPHLRMPTVDSNSWLFRTLLHCLNFMLPSDVIQKLMLFVILLLAGTGMHRLYLYLSNKNVRKYDQIAAYFAGTLFMINPYTYERLIAGQYAVIFGYALLPWFIISLFKLLDSPALKTAVVTGLWAIAVSIVSIHTIGFIWLFAFIAAGLKIWRLRGDKKKVTALLKFAGISATIFFIGISYWLVPLSLGKGATAENISSFGISDQAAFVTAGQGWIGRIGNVFHLQGFWVENTDTFTPPQASMPMWGFLIAFIWILIIIGIAKFLRDGKPDIVITFGGTGLLAAFLAAGTLNGWLAAHIPNFAGYREPQKFVSLLAVCMIVFAARGAAQILKYCSVQGGKFLLIVASVILLLIPVIWSHTMLWGFDNQLFASDYPPAWFAVNEKLDADHSRFKTLFLPWHLYMGFIFAGHIIANPAPQFFDKPVIVSDNPEFENIARSNSTPAKQKLDRLLHGYKGNDLGTKLAPLGIKYIILDQDDDYKNYLYVDKQNDLKLIYNSDTIKLYENLWYKGG